MDNDVQAYLRDILKFCRNTVDNLNSNSIVAVMREQNQNFARALDIVEKLLPAAEKIIEQDISDVSIRAATMFLIGLWSKLRPGCSVAELSKDDWNNVLGIVYEKAAEIDPQDYTRYVFDLYRKSIAFAIEPMRANASTTATSRLEEIVALMDGYAEDLGAGTMPEAKYIEENMWLSLEAVFLVLTDRMSCSFIPQERRELAEAIGALVFQKFRYRLYERELTVINECLEYQVELDQRLTEQVNAYIDALKEELDEFDALVKKAFDAKDFQSAFRGSIDLASSLGAEDILHTKQDVDDYFMS